MGTRDCRVDADVPVDGTGRIGVGQQIAQHLVPRAVTAVTAVAFPHRLPGAELVAGQDPPGDAGAVAVDDAVDDAAAIAEGPSPAAIA